MEFRHRFVLLLTLGVAFSLTIAATRASFLLGGIVAMFAVVIVYWVVLTLVRRTVHDIFDTE